MMWSSCFRPGPAFYTNSLQISLPLFLCHQCGSLEVHAATCGWNSPAAIQLYFQEESILRSNMIIITYSWCRHPIVAGFQSFYGSYASHGYFSNLVGGTDIITETSSNNQPSTIQYTYGTGIVTATTALMNWIRIWPGAGEMLVNDLNYSCQHHIDATSRYQTGNRNRYFLIIMAAFVRYKRFV